MLSQNVFFYTAAVCLVVLTVFLSWASHKLVKTLENVDKILLEIKGVTDELEVFKSGIKMGLVSLISALVSRLRLPSENSKGVSRK